MMADRGYLRIVRATPAESRKRSRLKGVSGALRDGGFFGDTGPYHRMSHCSRRGRIMPLVPAAAGDEIDASRGAGDMNCEQMRCSDVYMDGVGGCSRVYSSAHAFLSPAPLWPILTKARSGRASWHTTARMTTGRHE